VAALVGSVLLLMRSRYALYALCRVAGRNGAEFRRTGIGATPPPEMTAGAMKYVPAMIILLGLAQAWYAWREVKAGVLR